MSRRDDATTLRQMLDQAREIVAITSGRSAKEIQDDRLRQLALLRLLEVRGEAARRLSPEWSAAHPDVPLREIIGMRNWLIHAYDKVNLETLWRTVRDDEPRLVATLERLLR